MNGRSRFLSDLVAVLGKSLTLELPMANYFYTDPNGARHSINEQQLQALAAKGVITPTTPLETDTGHTGLAGQIPGLNFDAPAPPPFAQPAQATPPPANVFCTNCGNSVSEQAVACMSCGARPIGHKKFCRHCGVGLNPEQVICIKCGAGISTVSASRSVNGITTWGISKNRIVAAILAFVLGTFGVHKFYLGEWGWGLIYVFACLTTYGAIIPFIASIINGVSLLKMTDEDFTEEYLSGTVPPFGRW